MRARIWGVTCFSGMTKAATHVTAITADNVKARTIADRLPSFPSPNNNANAAARIGFISGEINMAPMMTAALFSRSPKSAISPASVAEEPRIQRQCGWSPGWIDKWRLAVRRGVQLDAPK